MTLQDRDYYRIVMAVVQPQYMPLFLSVCLCGSIKLLLDPVIANTENILFRTKHWSAIAILLHSDCSTSINVQTSRKSGFLF